MPAEKKSCYGCRALAYDIKRSQCMLGYRIKMNRKYTGSMPEPVPVNKHCPKPRTYAELDKLLMKDRGRPT